MISCNDLLYLVHRPMGIIILSNLDYDVGQRLLNGWITCDFVSFSIVFQSYQDDGKVIVQWNPIYV